MVTDSNGRVKIAVGHLLLVVGAIATGAGAVVGSYYKFSMDVQSQISTIVPKVSSNSESIELNREGIKENRIDIKGLAREH